MIIIEKIFIVSLQFGIQFRNNIITYSFIIHTVGIKKYAEAILHKLLIAFCENIFGLRVKYRRIFRVTNAFLSFKHASYNTLITTEFINTNK